MKAAPKQNSGAATKAWMRALALTAPLERNASVTLPVLIDSWADQFGDAIALISDEQSLTYRGLAERSHRYARWALKHGLGAGEVVGLLMRNCPEYLAIWLGITRVGGIVALLNTNLVGESLAHAINIVAPKHVIVGAELTGALSAIQARVDPAIKSWTRDEGGP